MAFNFLDTGAAATATAVTWTVNTGGGHTIGAGDLVILYAILGDPGTTFATAGTDLSPSGFTALINDYDGAHNGGYLHASWKIAAGGETIFTSATTSRNVQGQWAIIVYSGTTATPIDGNSLAISGSASATMTAVSVSPVGANDILLAFASCTAGGGTGAANFSGMTARLDTGGSASFTNQTQIYIAEQTLSSSGATGAKTATQSGVDFYYSGLVAIRMAPSAAIASEGIQKGTIFTPPGGPSRGLRRTQAFAPRSSAYSVTVNVNNVGVVSYLKSAAKNLPVTSTGTVSYLKATGKLIAVASSGAVSYLKSIAKTLSVASASSTLVSAISSAIGIQVGIAQGFLFKPGRGPMWDIKRRQAFPASAAGNQFLVAVTANSSGTVSYVKASGKNVAVSSSGTVSYLKAVARQVAIASSGAVSYLKAVTKTLAVTSSGAVSAVKSTTKTILATCAGAVTAAGIKARIVIITATATGAVSVKRAVGKTVSVVSSGATSAVKGITKAVAIAATGSVSFAKSIAKSFAVVASGLVSVIATFRASGAGAVYHVTVSVVSTTLTQWLARFIKAKGPESTPRASGWPAAPRGV